MSSPGGSTGPRCRPPTGTTFRSFDVEPTVPGRATVPAVAVTNVTMSATHRRRGLVSRMMSRRQRTSCATTRGVDRAHDCGSTIWAPRAATRRSWKRRLERAALSRSGRSASTSPT
ncbi:GNAT family N-acetyltransferase [Streptomyces sp. CLV115]|uniref:GNAT family N-acetyltransferase n=1 Tax=Streptomyces sp. CLV115 TaxID=3138502 RepID=UPI00406D221D